MTSSLAIRHKADQDRLAQLLAAETTALVAPVGRSELGDLVDMLAALTFEYAQASAVIAADFYDDARGDAGFTDGFTVPLADPVEERIVRSLEWALQGLTDAASDLEATQTRVEGSATRLALLGGRETVVGAAKADPKATGWTRVARPDACAFCALLATRVFDTRGRVRGPYESRQSASTRESDGGSYHDDCRCSVEPVFAGQEYRPEPHVRGWAALYADSTADVTGRKKLAAFRAALAEQRRT